MDVCASPSLQSSVSELQMQSQVLALEDGKRELEAKMLQEHQQRVAAVAKNNELYDQIQAVTKSLEEKCRVAVCEADQKMTLLQVGLQLDCTSAVCLVVHYIEKALLMPHAQKICSSSDRLGSRVCESHCQWHQSCMYDDFQRSKTCALIMTSSDAAGLSHTTGSCPQGEAAA